MAGDYGNGGDLVPDNEPQGGYCIEIYVGPDNKVQRVGVEQKAAPAPMGEGQEPTSKPAGNAQSIEQALDMAMRIYESGGQMTDDAAPGLDRETIARKVFGDEIVNQSEPGELNRKSRAGYQ